MKIYTKKLCQNCEMVKAEFKKYGFSFEEYDIDEIGLKEEELKRLPIIAYGDKSIDFTTVEDAICFANKWNGFPEVVIIDEECVS